MTFVLTVRLSLKLSEHGLEHFDRDVDTPGELGCIVCNRGAIVLELVLEGDDTDGLCHEIKLIKDTKKEPHRQVG